MQQRKRHLNACICMSVQWRHIYLEALYSSLLLKHVNSFPITINSISETSCKLHSFALLFGFMLLHVSQRAHCLRTKKSTDPVDIPGTPQRAPVCEGGWPRHRVFLSPLRCQRSKYKRVCVCTVKRVIVFVTHSIMALKSQKKICLESLNLSLLHCNMKKNPCVHLLQAALRRW